MKRELELTDWLNEVRTSSPAEQRKLQGVSTVTAAQMLDRTRVTIWAWVAKGKLDVVWICDSQGVELFHFITYGSIQKLIDTEDSWSEQILLDWEGEIT